MGWQYGRRYVPDDLHPGKPNDQGGYIDNLYDDDGLVGRARFYPDEPEEDEDQDAIPSEDEIEGAALAVLGGLALVGLTIAAVGAAVGASAAAVNASEAACAARKEKTKRRELEWSIAEARRSDAQPAMAQRRVRAPAGWYDDGSGRERWWDGEEWTEHFYSVSPRVGAPAGWYDDGSGRDRWWDGEEWTEHFYSVSPRVGAPAGWYDDGSGRDRWWDGQEWTEHFQESRTNGSTTSLAASDKDPVDHCSNSALIFDPPRISMSSAEWQERVRAMLLARAISDVQWRILSDARIEDADNALLGWQDELRKLTPERFSDYIDYLLATNSSARRHALQSAVAGWYNDGSGRSRWWDGQAWTDHFQQHDERDACRPAGFDRLA